MATLSTLTNPALRRIARVLQLTQTLVLVLVLGTASALVFSARGYGEANDWVVHTHEVLDQLQRVRTAALRGGIALRNHALVPQAASLETLRSASVEARKAALALEALVDDNEAQSARATELRAEVMEIAGWLLSSAVIAERDGPGALRRLLDERISSDGTRRLRVLLDDMEHAERLLLTARQDAQNRELAALKRWAIGLGGLFTAFMLGTIAYSSRLVRLSDQDMSKLEVSADTDPLTGLFNRRALERKTRELQGRAMAVMVFDLDGFKQVNDRYGHGAGDEVLRTVGLRLREQCREADILARVGGDEFIAVLPGLDEVLRAGHIQARLNLALGEPVEIDGMRIAIGASIGYAVSRGEKSFEELVAAADEMSYQEKKRRTSGHEGRRTA
ncbi:diguanylate cyclase [Pelomonas sp. CA6]|uniref:diguanylate cyclase domain-containing protein n=1 Tax=Pelomonas sp. CA6 TaxID=2907999 RepID=UPI001F4C2D09|nr:diguanylate cyclase [Pelomonas sp. CA6]MCH7343812.1 diguanylate cyclase [Pelomonas sp. CA6]